MLRACALLLAGAAGSALAAPLPFLTLKAPGYSVQAEVRRAVRPTAAGAYFEAAPAQVRAVLRRPGDPWRAGSGEPPTAFVTVTPVQNWLTLYKGATAQAVRAQLDLIRQIGAGQRTLNSFRAQGPLPFLPLVNAEQVLWGAAQRVSTAQLQGVRYLTAFRQDASPLRRSDIFYTFQGLTHDGRFAVSVRLPYAPSGVPAQVGPGDAPNDWARYIRQAQAKLDAETGQLTRLDALVASIRVR